MASLTFLGLAEKVLNEEKRPLAPSEIWKIAVSKKYSSEVSSEGKTPGQSLYSAIFTDARDNPNTKFVRVGDSPYRYFLKSLAHNISASDLEAQSQSIPKVPEPYNYKEIQLHPFLARFAHVNFDARAKTIRHSTSSKTEYGEWVHPDMIAVYYPDWRDEVRDLSQMTGGFSVKVYSFEIKRTLSFANLRASFFQAVSNSSFAHQGYLVAADISTDEDFREELRRLSASFGIGVIEIDIEDPDASKVVVPARERDNLDWDALNKVAMNPDVKELLSRIKKDVITREIRLEHYDEVLDPKLLVQSIQSAGSAHT